MVALPANWSLEECRNRSMVSMPKCSPNSVCNRVAAVLSACFWSMERSGWSVAKGTGLSVMSNSVDRRGGFGVVRDDDVVGGGGGIRVESGDQRQSEECSADLGGDETGRGAGRDTGEGVGENPTDGDGGVGEGRAAGEPVGRADVRADGCGG